MKLVLDAAQEIGINYGIIVNKVKKKMMRNLENNEMKAKFLSNIFAGIDEGRRCDVTNVTFLSVNEDLDEEENMLIDHAKLNILQGIPFKVQ